MRARCYERRRAGARSGVGADGGMEWSGAGEVAEWSAVCCSLRATKRERSELLAVANAATGARNVATDVAPRNGMP